MRFEDKIKLYSKERIWDEYCGFLEMSISDYMFVQKRLMEEQMHKWCESGLGKSIIGEYIPKSIDEFRQRVPLTTYEDYADILLSKQEDMLPATASIWIQTTWEGGIRPIKIAPYTREMIDVYKHNAIACLLLSCAKEKGDMTIKAGDSVLYGGAPLPYLTGLLPVAISEECSFTWLPDCDSSSEKSFSERIKEGFKMANSTGIDYIFGIGSVNNFITNRLLKSANAGKSSGSGTKMNASLTMIFRYIKAKYVSKRDKRPIEPYDLFKLKGFVSVGTDARCYKESLAKHWGCEPIEIMAGTESSCVGTEDYLHNGMVFFPDTCFYEFLSESEYIKSLEDENYTPHTCLIDEVIQNTNYELVITVLKGGAFARYRTNDMYSCVSGPKKGALPRFSYLDRGRSVIDIAGFTRITEKSIKEAIAISRLPIVDWIAKKEYTDDNVPFLHIYAEIDPTFQLSHAVVIDLFSEQLTAYFKYFDSDYSDLKHLLKMDPMTFTVLPYGSIAECEQEMGIKIRRINPDVVVVNSIMNNCN